MKSVYIHIPFCNQICSYCDFVKMFYNEEQVDKYLVELKNEIQSNYKNDIVKTIYIGGGTPTSLDKKQLKTLIEIINIFKKDKDCEITVETNIDVDLDKLKLLKPYINRLSIGVQSFNKKILSYLNRKNDVDIEEKIKEIKKIGYNNINVDLMYAIPNENIKTLKTDLKRLIDLDIQHISTYSLILEPHTKLYIQNEKPINEDLDYKMYKIIIKTLKQNNFIHYEISNFSKEGYQSKHNLTYWNNEEYYGFGLGSSGYINSVRYSNTRSLTNYLKKNYIFEKEVLDMKDKISYEMILGLRKTEGISLIDFKKKYNIDVRECFDLDSLIKNKQIIIKNNRLYINKKYIYTSNDILINFLRSEINGKI